MTKKRIFYIVIILIAFLGITARAIYLLTNTKQIPDTNGEDTSVVQLSPEDFKGRSDYSILGSGNSYTGGRTKSYSDYDYDNVWVSFGKASGIIVVQSTKATGTYSFEIKTTIASGNCEVGVFEDKRLLYRYPSNEKITKEIDINEDHELHIVIFCESAKGDVTVRRTLKY